MNPYGPPSTSTPVVSISLVAIGILSAGTIGLSFIASVLCGFCCYLDIAGNMNDDFVAILLIFGAPLLLFTCVGIPAGMIQLRRKLKLDQISAFAYIVVLTALAGASLFENPLIRWFSISLICCLASIVVSIRSAVRYQQAVGGK